MTTRQAVNERPRCLHGMPDLGNPNILGGLCWWKEYLPLLLDAGWEAPIEYQSTSKIGFRDGPATTPVCIAKHVPIRLLLKDDSTILFSETIELFQTRSGYCLEKWT